MTRYMMNGYLPPRIDEIRRMYPMHKVTRYRSMNAWVCDNDYTTVFVSYWTTIAAINKSSNTIQFYKNPYSYGNATTKQFNSWLSTTKFDTPYIRAMLYNNLELNRRYPPNNASFSRNFANIRNQSWQYASVCRKLHSACYRAMYEAYTNWCKEYETHEWPQTDYCVALAKRRGVHVLAGCLGARVYTCKVEFEGRFYCIVADYESGTFSIDKW